ncbi:uncharacterized protein KGF55_004844 [Candida pseudojiufengensis]|uniref:uncharacterized protein n=1 Tax=Candida pseudojiufengensis TaxID=497109 RepID=UPI00222413ED|nr:uncharacterized protein KGF55_004844 [Candida pseudojiufengensis]KAI5960121.1 hypothetical protein KGF55_004844 [Candida pseudojiufengensis]
MINDETEQCSRLVLINGNPKYYHTIILLKEIKEFKNNELEIIEIENVNASSSPPKRADYIHICVEYQENSWDPLDKFVSFLKKNKTIVDDAKEIGVYIHFQPGKSWKEYSPKDLREYKSFLKYIKDSCGDKVTQFAIIDKYDMETVYMMEDEDKEDELKEEIQSDIIYWNNLRTLDYCESSIRKFPDIKLPDTLEFLNIGGGYALDSLRGFKMPPKLKVLRAGHGAIAFLENVIFPDTLEELDLTENKLYFLDGIKFPPNLKHLDVSQNRIEDLKFANFPNSLETLSLGFNPIETMKGAKFPPNLKQLEISNTPNESMAGVKFPESLEILNLQTAMSGSKGLKLPTKVKTLILSENEITSIGPLKIPPTVEILYLNGNKIKTLNKITFPPNLKELRIGDNLLTTLKNVNFPPTLEILDIDNNPDSYAVNEKQIITLKDVILPPNLKVFKLGYHGLRVLENYEFPSTLKTLSLAYNELKYIRNIKFPNLTLLDLSGNEELITLDGIDIPESVTEFRVSPDLLPNLPAKVTERANNNNLTIKQSAPKPELLFM